MFGALDFSNNTFLSLCNFTAYQITRRLALTSAGHYGSRCHQYAVRAGNALYRLGVSEETVNRTIRWLYPGAFVIDLKKCKILVRTRNCLNDFSPEKLEKISSRVQEIYRAVLIYPFFKIKINKNSSWLGDGVCQGMVQHFIKEYFRNSQKGQKFEIAATNAARTVEDGANIEVCALQWLHQATKLDTSILNAQDYDADFKFKIHLSGRANLGYASLRSEFPCLSVKFQTPLTTTNFLNLGDGIYDITLGWRIEKQHEKTIWNLPAGYGHAIALIINEGHFLVFDPNYGLISYQDPNNYFNAAKFFDTNNAYSISKICLSDS
ncbi:MAG: hypothetical protein S4CHLAM45_02260 [Chlamydiales bacterium]|nr:hypothetical protein [Chlamydiales bacterium]MCH9619085.1 hypothetical protein [Chlamydiales bacterium]MCH9622347.1 hypothetical protein [Chlamydiales bacterium]